MIKLHITLVALLFPIGAFSQGVQIVDFGQPEQETSQRQQEPSQLETANANGRNAGNTGNEKSVGQLMGELKGAFSDMRRIAREGMKEAGTLSEEERREIQSLGLSEEEAIHQKKEMARRMFGRLAGEDPNQSRRPAMSTDGLSESCVSAINRTRSHYKKMVAQDPASTENFSQYSAFSSAHLENMTDVIENCGNRVMQRLMSDLGAQRF